MPIIHVGEKSSTSNNISCIFAKYKQIQEIVSVFMARGGKFHTSHFRPSSLTWQLMSAYDKVMKKDGALEFKSPLMLVIVRVLGMYCHTTSYSS